MPNRILKENICVSDDIDRLTWFQEVLFYRLLVNCDDFGRMDGRISVIMSKLFPLKDRNHLQADVVNGIQLLADANMIQLYMSHGKPYISVTNWKNHQNIRAKKSKYPEPEEFVNTFDINCNHMISHVPVIQSNPIRNSYSYSESNPISMGEKEEGVGEANEPRAKVTRFTPPTVEEVETFCKENMYTIDAQKFVDYYTSNGWIVGKTKMKDWKATVRGWERREQEKFAKEQRQPKGGFRFDQL